jgi:exodeoxyribonuclease VII large subunit
LIKRLEAANLRLRFARIRHQQELLEQKLTKLAAARLIEGRRRHESLDAHLTQLSPLAVLSRGYAIVTNEQGHIIRAAKETSVGEPVHIRLHSGGLSAAVTATRGADTA